MWKNLASHQVKGLHIVNINPQTDFNYLFQYLPFCMSTFCFNYTVAGQGDCESQWFSGKITVGRRCNG